MKPDDHVNEWEVPHVPSTDPIEHLSMNPNAPFRVATDIVPTPPTEVVPVVEQPPVEVPIEQPPVEEPIPTEDVVEDAPDKPKRKRK